ncbi:oligosaccharide flippase family protein [Ideonella sp. DXS22W]|uniref:Oligosaccharide flippase family protein n=1 Tax=Pseudaquabacterium inlustre TaxID=2984192 RepID=A0ABU9CH71_9BURK
MATSGLRRAVFTLLAGGALAQALPLALGPWLTRLYSPESYGQYHLFAAVAANLAVVACARYEFALPMAADESEARALRALCQRVLAGVLLLTTLGAVAWAWRLGAVWPLWLPASVGALGGLSLATLSATRAQRFRALASARVLQHGGGAVGQVAIGLLQASVHGLIAGALAAVLAALAVLRPAGADRAAEVDRAPDWRGAARRFRDYPLLNTPHAFLGALQDTVAVALIAAQLGAAAAGAWGLALRYLKAPATLVGGAVSQALHPRLAQAGRTPAGRALVLRTMALLALIAAPLVVGLWAVAPALFGWAFGAEWSAAGELGRALALYIGLHFVASPLGVVTLAWDAQAWALKLALVGQGLFVAALAAGLAWDGLRGAGWAVSLAMAVYFGWYFLKLATWPVAEVTA